MDENIDCTRASAHWMMMQPPPPSSEIAMLYTCAFKWQSSAQWSLLDPGASSDSDRISMDDLAMDLAGFGGGSGGLLGLGLKNFFIDAIYERQISQNDVNALKSWI